MVVTRSGVGRYRPQHVKRGLPAHLLLHDYVRLDLIDRHMAGTFHHSLTSHLSACLGKFTIDKEFLYLDPVCSIMDRACTKTVAEAQTGIIFFHDSHYSVEMLVKDRKSTRLNSSH